MNVTLLVALALIAPVVVGLLVRLAFSDRGPLIFALALVFIVGWALGHAWATGRRQRA